MRARICLVALGLLVLPLSAVAAELLDDNTRTECKGDRCIGSYCSLDGDATNCWQESVLHRKPGQEVHWICTRHGHKCKWIQGPIPDNDDKWNVIQF